MGMTSWAVSVCLRVRVVSLTEKGPTSGPGVRLQVAPQMCCMSCHCAEFACIHHREVQLAVTQEIRREFDSVRAEKSSLTSSLITHMMEEHCENVAIIVQAENS